jgi:hypothetical protein
VIRIITQVTPTSPLPFNHRRIVHNILHVIAEGDLSLIEYSFK